MFDEKVLWGIVVVVLLIGFERWSCVWERCPQCSSYHVRVSIRKDPGFSGLRRQPDTKIVTCHKCGKISTRELTPEER